MLVVNKVNEFDEVQGAVTWGYFMTENDLQNYEKAFVDARNELDGARCFKIDEWGTIFS
jgi:hypothetical protein